MTILFSCVCPRHQLKMIVSIFIILTILFCAVPTNGNTNLQPVMGNKFQKNDGQQIVAAVSSNIRKNGDPAVGKPAYNSTGPNSNGHQDVQAILNGIASSSVQQTITGGSSFLWKDNLFRKKPPVPQVNTGDASTVSFYKHLLNNYKSTDIYYVVTGDTQYWYQCTRDNRNCLARTNCTVRDNWTESDLYRVRACQKLQGDYANAVQQRSINDLNKMIKDVTRKDLSGLVINGDLVMFGNESEISRLKEQWLNFFPFTVYPGLGNHDDLNNINKCPDQLCLNRILTYFVDYVSRTLKFSLDYERSYDQLAGKMTFNGSFAYSWDECSNSACFHFVQLNYHPFYSRVIDSKEIKWLFRPSMKWLENDLRKNSYKPVVLNFHAVDSAFNETHRLQLVNFVKRMVTEYSVNILAVMFAHLHEKVGLKETWCFNQGRTRVPLIYSGSVPANNYVLMQLSTDTKNVKFMYKIHAQNETVNLVDILNLQQNCTLIY